jgi:uncharacterized membrane protein
MKSSRVAMTVYRPRDEVERLWQSSEHRPEYIAGLDADVTFKDAPGDRGNEVHVDLGRDAGDGPLGVARKIGRSQPLAKVKDEMRRFKQHVETGVIPRSDGAPEGELAKRKLKQRPAQPLDDSELEKAGVR